MALPKIYTDENAARKHLEGLLWPQGPVCPHCGTQDEATLLKGKSTRPGVFKCRACEKPFSVTVGTVFERSKIKLNTWVYAVDLYTASKKGFSAHQLHRTIGVTYKTAWFMAHRIREAMNDSKGPKTPMGGSGKVVEADETYFGPTAEDRVSAQRKGRPYNPRGSRGPKNKRTIVSLVERGGEVRSFHVAFADSNSVAAIVNENIAKESRLHTDESRLYTRVGENFASHETVVHSRKEYARGDVTTNSVEGYFSIFKRGMKGVYQHCAEHHLHRYLAEFDFRYNRRIALGYNDAMRGQDALKGIAGKRLTYHRPNAI